jgi:hypothetical protein
VVLPDRHVFRHIAAGLAEKPYGRSVNRLTQAGSHKAAAAVWVEIGADKRGRSWRTHSYKPSIGGMN